MSKIFQLLIMVFTLTGCTQFIHETFFYEQTDIVDEQTSVSDANSDDYEEIYIYKTPYKEKTEAKKEKTTKPLFNLETSVRCVVDVKNKDVITTIPFKHEAFDIYRLNKGDNLPRYEVTGYTFMNELADNVFRNLLQSANIKVIATDKYYPEISANNITGELENILDSIADASDLYYTYNAERKTLYLTRHARLAFAVPNRELLLPALDALQGAGIQDISIDWADNVLVFDSDKLQEKKALKLIELFKQEPQLAMFDVTVFHVEPVNGKSEVDWTSLINIYGTDSIKSGDQGNVGKILVTSHIVNQKTLISLLSAQARVYQVAQGEFSVPNGWRSRFDIWNCGNVDISENEFSILAKTKIENQKLYSEFGLDTAKGEISHFDAINRLDENIVIFGIQSSALGYDKAGELIILLSPRIIDVIKEN